MISIVGEPIAYARALQIFEISDITFFSLPREHTSLCRVNDLLRCPDGFAPQQSHRALSFPYLQHNVCLSEILTGAGRFRSGTDMEALLVKILATALAFSQVTVTPRAVKTEF